jgi:hypothetical protein
MGPMIARLDGPPGTHKELAHLRGLASPRHRARLRHDRSHDPDRNRLARPGRRRDQHGQLPGHAGHKMFPNRCSAEGVVTQQRFLFEVPEADLQDLRARLGGTRWPIPWPATGWEAGTDAAELHRLVQVWGRDFDWRAQEAALNALPSHMASIDGTAVHFLKFDGEDPDARAEPACFGRGHGIGHGQSRPGDEEKPSPVGVRIPYGCPEARRGGRHWSHRCRRNRRPSDYETDARRQSGRLQADLAYSRWRPRRSRRL